MTPNEELLQSLRVASPCRAAWDQMAGDERVRYCAACRKHVYNLTAMSADEAAALVREKEGSLCVRLYQRRDGTALAGNCPVGFAAARRALVGQMGLIVTFFAGIPAVAGLLRMYGSRWPIWNQEPMRTVGERLGIIEPLVMGKPQQFVTMGAVASPPRPSR